MSAGFLLLLGTCAAWGQDSVRYRLRDLEVFGTDKVRPERIRERFAEQLKEYLSAKGRKTASAVKQAERLQGELEAGVRELGGLPWVRLELSEAGGDGKATDVVLTFEAVEKSSMAARLPLRERPAKTIEDAAGLLDAWQSYYDLGWSLMREGKVGLERPECPAFYCTWGGATPELKALQRRFMIEVQDHLPMLEEIFRADADGARRARALYLLSYRREGSEVVLAAAYGLEDPDRAVREAALLILNDIAIFHPELPLPLPQVVRMLDYPYAEDRERAMAVLVSAANRKDCKTALLEAAPKVAALLRLKHPSNRSMAYTLLGFLSGEKFAETDQDAWDEWARKAAEGQGKEP